MTANTAPERAPPIGADRFEIWTALLLAVAVTATSWSSYQAALWSGVQAANYSRANGLRVESTRASSKAETLTVIDAAIFSQWLNAYATNHHELAAFYRRCFRAEFVPAFNAWVAQRPRLNPDAPANPFSLPEYRLQSADDATRLAEQAEATFDAGQTANKHSDSYVLNTVIFAAALFFAGISTQFQRRRTRALRLIAATALCAFGIYHLLVYPAL